MIVIIVHGKKGGNTLLYFRIICLIISVAAFAIILNYSRDAANDTLLEKNYRARDIALLVTTLYASPGGVNYTYMLKEPFKVEIGNGEVLVSDKKDEEIIYWYTRPNDGKDITGTDGITPVVIDGKGNTVILFQRGKDYLMAGVVE